VMCQEMTRRDTIVNLRLFSTLGIRTSVDNAFILVINDLFGVEECFFPNMVDVIGVFTCHLS
jgi:hypothetical protein